MVRVEIGALGGSVSLADVVRAEGESLAVVWVEIGVLGWVLPEDVVGGEGEHGGGSRGGGWWPRGVSVRG
jgi:hypothetical protein